MPRSRKPYRRTKPSREVLPSSYYAHCVHLDFYTEFFSLEIGVSQSQNGLLNHIMAYIPWLSLSIDVRTVDLAGDTVLERTWSYI